MRLSVLLLIIMALRVSANSYSQTHRLTIEKNDVTIAEVFNDIESKSDFSFLYSTREVDVTRHVSYSGTDVLITDILSSILEGKDIAYRITDKHIILYKPDASLESAGFVQQGIVVTGSITDDTGAPLPGVNITVKGTQIGVISDNNGNYTITVPNKDAVLVFSYIGFVQQELTVGNQSRMNVIMNEDVHQMEEVVVVGYGVQKKVNLSGSVQSISTQSIANRPVTNANLALQGLGANVNIQELTGRANYAADINIRGFTSINGGSALILLDNVPVTAEELSRINPADIESVSVLKDAASAAIYGGRASYGVLLITTKQARSDKLSVNVNLNAGSRLLSYVPDLITDVYEVMTLQNPCSTRNPLYSPEEVEYGRLRSEHPDQYPAAVINRRQGLYNLGDWAYWDNIDWNRTLLRNATPTYNASIQVANRTEKLNYAVSGGYYKQDGVMRYGNDTYDRFNMRGNGSYKLTSWWQLGTNLSFNYSNYDMPEAGTDEYFWQVSRSALRSLYNPDGTFTIAGATLVDMPQNGGRNVTKTNETQLSFSTTIDLIKDVWNIKADANIRFTNKLSKVAHFPVYYRDGPEKALLPYFANTGGAMRTSAFSSTASTLNNYQVYNIYTDYHKTFADKHYIQALVGFNQESLRYTYSLVRRNGLITNSLPTIQLATGDFAAEEKIQTLALRGAFGRLNYIFDNKYILEFNGRYDGTSRFQKDTRFGFFPSGSAAWVLSRESFFESVAEMLKIDQLKFRGSYGVLGNQAVTSYYPYIVTMPSGNILVPINGNIPLTVYQPGYTIPSNNNANGTVNGLVAGDLTWERVRTVNFGGDLALFNNRITLGVDVYTRYTEGMLVPGKALPSVFGADAPRINAGDLKTKGWEIMLGLNNTWQVSGSPLHVSLNFMLADSRAYVTKYENSAKLIYSQQGTANYYEGQEIGEIWGFISDGYLTKDDLILRPDGTPSGNAKIDQYDVSEEDNRSTGVSYEGDIKFKKIDMSNPNRITFGKGTVDDPGDRIIIGNNRPRLPYSSELNASWKGFDLRAFFQGIGKRDWIPGGNDHAFWGVYGNPWNTPIKANRDHWTPENPNARWPRLKPYIAENLELALPQTGYIQDASYVRLKNLTVGYTLPVAWTSRWHVAMLRLYFSGENLFTIHHLDVNGVDPEILTQNFDGTRGGTMYPTQKAVSFGINLNF